MRCGPLVARTNEIVSWSEFEISPKPLYSVWQFGQTMNRTLVTFIMPPYVIMDMSRILTASAGDGPLRTSCQINKLVYYLPSLLIPGLWTVVIMPASSTQQSSKRRRVVTSCSECYRRKQKVRTRRLVYLFEDLLSSDVHPV